MTSQQKAILKKQLAAQLKAGLKESGFSFDQWRDGGFRVDSNGKATVAK